ncbi:hypothetical protein G7Z17_g7289 [Cylindrodendrum hubeiense]|uniref:Nascent polypeptide-associated complex subunit beta n=1 Tax=Cylindrodendrum hubeiense TaxID=595255 RepID=A0A9P5HBN6_9HYPO|nr:hypothetical protein G7Z17_g7289 [Cylindrodendrum hubeiense]
MPITDWRAAAQAVGICRLRSVRLYRFTPRDWEHPWRKGGGARCPLGEMVVPQAKTLGTHKIYSNPSPLLEADGVNSSLPTPISPVRRPSCAHALPPAHQPCALDFPRPNPRPLTSPIAVPTSLGFPRTEPSTLQHNMSDVQERLKKLGLVSSGARIDIGGKGTPRRKVKRAPARSGADDKKLQQQLKKLNTQPIQGIEEVNMFKSDGNVIHFAAPKVHAAVPANTFAIYGAGEDKELTELVPGILNQLGPDSLASLRKLAESYQNMQKAEKGEDEDDIPDLVEGENFESKVE